jgi:pimeloyl-ACP methyl ester carboxylesterase
VIVYFAAAAPLIAFADVTPANTRLIDDVGHTLHWEQPETFARLLLEFVN